MCVRAADSTAYILVELLVLDVILLVFGLDVVVVERHLCAGVCKSVVIWRKKTKEKGKCLSCARRRGDVVGGVSEVVVVGRPAHAPPPGNRWRGAWARDQLRAAT
jgi:hypothetical protein